MHRKLLVLVFVLLCFTKAYSQNASSNRCASVQYLNDQIARDPQLLQNLLQEELNLQQQIAAMLQTTRTYNTVYVIPVVVHVLYYNSAQNITDAQILSQIDVLNEDYGRYNSDTTNTPSAFAPVSSSTNFQFCLARKDPTGNPTTGIERRQTSTQNYSAGDQMKYFSQGGLDAWDVNKYLNIWVCGLDQLVLGFGSTPSTTHSNTFGLVISYTAFGRGGSAVPPYNKGRTATHELGHCFGLRHIWGDDGGSTTAARCAGSDFINDTPNQDSATYGCATFPFMDDCSTVSPGIMFMNYMDYVNDNCMNMFTAGQSVRMLAAVNTYYPTLLTSDGCTEPIDIDELNGGFQFNFYPNPTKGFVTIDMFSSRNIGKEAIIEVTNTVGTLLKKYIADLSRTYLHQVDLRSFPPGVYFITVTNSSYRKTVPVIMGER